MIPIKRYLETLRRAGAESMQDYLGLGGGMFLHTAGRKERTLPLDVGGFIYATFSTILHN